ncbi:MAG: hypothetical protein ABI969_03290 [bacterium]
MVFIGKEPIGADDGREFGTQHFYGDVAVVLEIVREIHGGHAARAKHARNGVAVGKSRAQLLECSSHFYG